MQGILLLSTQLLQVDKGHFERIQIELVLVDSPQSTFMAMVIFKPIASATCCFVVSLCS
jgi:hypothetical protein